TRTASRSTSRTPSCSRTRTRATARSFNTRSRSPGTRRRSSRSHRSPPSSERRFVPTKVGIAMTDNKTLVLKAFDTLFNKRDYDAAAKFWSPDYVQHSAHIPPGRDGLFNLVRSAPPEMRYENHIVPANGHFALLHGRSG